MKYLSLLLFLFTGLSSFSQDLSKPQYYFDTEGSPVEKTDYLKKAKDPKYTYIPRIIENDTAIIGTLYLREEIGVMLPEQRLEVIKNLELLTGQKVKENQTIVINFFAIPIHRDSYNSFFRRYVKDGSYNRFFRNNTDFIQFYISQKDYTPEDFVEDKNRFFESLFLGYLEGDASYIIIKPNGHFLRRLSEHRQDEIIDKAKADW